MLVLRADLLIALVIFLFALGVSFAAIATTPAMAKRTAEIKTEA
ncbi:MAG TPA: hypothetical protein VFF30_01485 [Nitrososphaerales archaeon]|nr:hypothetical protein [Nitrososphaerales archaeon]